MISLHRILAFKFFDETGDAERAREIYKRTPLLSVLVVAAAISSIAGLALVFLDTTAALRVLLVSIGISAVTAGYEWHLGLKARALNQLIYAVAFVAVFGIVFQ